MCRTLTSENKKPIPANNFLTSAEVHLMEATSETGSPTFYTEKLENEKVVPQQLKNIFFNVNRINMDSLQNLDCGPNSINA